MAFFSHVGGERLDESTARPALPRG